MALLELALAYVLKNEGGFVNNASDRGGATNMGISTPTLTAYLGRPATVEDVKNLTTETVTDIYRRNYWAVIQGDKINSQLVATLLMDMAVLMGPRQAVKMAQGVVGAPRDGIMGPKTMAMLNTYAPAKFALAFQGEAQEFFIDLVTADTTHTQLQFLHGWWARSKLMTTLGYA